MPVKGNRARCPHCDTVCLTVKTVPQTALVREIVYACPECAHVFVVQVVVVRTINPSQRPRDGIRISGAA